MISELITDIGELTTQDEDRSRQHDAAIVIANGRVAWIGRAADAPAADIRTSVAGRAVLPGWVDSHSHIVFSDSREAEFEARIAGRRYEAGGIAATVAATDHRSVSGSGPPSTAPPRVGSPSRLV